MTDESKWLTIKLRLQGQRVVAAQLAQTAAGARAYGDVVHGVGKKTEFTRIETFAWSESMYILRRRIYQGTLAILGLEAGVVKLGYDFNKTESDGIGAMTGILGSSKLARREVRALVGISDEVGGSFSGLVKAAEDMLNFGFTTRATNAYLKTFDDYTQKRGTGAAGLSSLVSSFTKIKSRGFLTGLDVRLLQGQGIDAFSILKKQLQLTPAQAYQLRHGQLEIPARYALPALATGIRKSVASQPKTLPQILSITKNWTEELSGALDKPLFAWFTKQIPAVNARLKAATEGFKSGGMAGLLTGLDPSGHLTQAWLAFANVLKVSGEVLRFVWRIAKPFVMLLSGTASLLSLAARNTTLLRIAMWSLATWYGITRGRLLALILVKKVNLALDKLEYIYVWLGVRALQAQALWSGRSAAAMWLLNLAMDANPVVLIAAGIVVLAVALGLLYWKVGAVRNVLNDTFGWVKSHWPLLAEILAAPFTFGLSLILTHIGMVKGAIRGAINYLLRGWNMLHFRIPGFHLGPVHFGGANIGLPQLPMLGDGGRIVGSGNVIVGDRGPEMLRLPRGAQVVPLDQNAAGGIRDMLKLLIEVVPQAIMLDGKKVGEVVFDVKQTAEGRA